MIFYYIFCIVLAIFYVYLLSGYITSWNKIEDWQTPNDFLPSRFLSIVIAARNEVKDIAACLNTITDNDYPKNQYEIILIDDHSEDETYKIASTLNIPNLKILKQEEGRQGKKQALKLGIRESKGELILTTDADCTYDKDWLSTMVSYFEGVQAKLVTGPIAFENPKGIFQKFQALDLNGLMVITASGIQSEKQFMANGANMLYSKEIFDEVNGYRGNEHLASGDDMFLVHKVSELYPNDVHFVKAKASEVYTAAEADLLSFLQQRKRWATKTTHYTDRALLSVLVSVFLLCITIVLNVFIFSWFSSLFLFIGIFQLFIKMILDYLFLSNITGYFETKSLMKSFFPANVMHLFYICYSGIAGLFGGTYEWKGREVS